MSYSNPYKRSRSFNRGYSAYRNSDYGFLILIGLVFAAVVIGIISWLVAVTFHTATFTNCKVEDKDRTSDSKGHSDMRVYSSCGNFKVDDSWLSGTFHSSDTYREIKVGKTYDFDTRGRRIPFLSEFPNIVKFHEAK